MQLRATDEERALQAEVRAFLAEARLTPDDLPRSLDARMEVLRELAGGLPPGRLRRARLAGGLRRRRPAARRADRRRPGARGCRRPRVRQRRRARRARARRSCASARTSSARRYIPPILSAEEIWCQGFSEPDAGSDLASLRTRAVEHDDHFVLSGQKTWVSWGQYARWCGVLARTDDTVARHRGISMLIVDMRVARGRGAADDADHRARGIQRALPRRRRRAEGEPARRARRRLEDRDAHARPRARHRGAAAPGEAADVARPRGARRGAARARRGAASSTTRRRRSSSRARSSASRSCATTPTGRSASSSTAARSAPTARASSC